MIGQQLRNRSAEHDQTVLGHMLEQHGLEDRDEPRGIGFSAVPRKCGRRSSTITSNSGVMW